MGGCAALSTKFANNVEVAQTIKQPRQPLDSTTASVIGQMSKDSIHKDEVQSINMEPTRIIAVLWI